ncbi:hypothetical protein QUC31_009112 [Theobroma cacao]|nr:hypothetical protein QQP08_010139 [Theobroma cacao]
MGPYAKTMILLLLLVYLDPFIGRVKAMEHVATSANSATNEGMNQVKMRKLTLEVDIQKDYNPIPNPKHEPPPRGKSGAPAGGGN